MFPYNNIQGRLVLNLLGEVLSIFHLSLKYSLFNGSVGTVKGDREVAQECYLNSLKVVREPFTLSAIPRPKMVEYDMKS